MINFQKITLLLLFLHVILVCISGCTDKCGRLSIEFPFYLRNNNFSHNSSYPPGFELFCNDKKETLLQLPAVPFQLFVKRIDYKSQQIEIYDPQSCLPNVFLKLANSSVYPFQFLPFPPQQVVYKYDVSFFLCNSMSCPICKKSYDFLIDPEMISCTKLKDVWSVEWYVDSEPGQINSIMTWSKSKHNCSQCEAQGQKCKWKNGTQGETECFSCPTNSLSTSTIIYIAAGGTFALILLLLLVMAFFHVYQKFKTEAEDQTRIEKFLEDYKRMKPTRFTYADIKRITNGFSESLGEGAHGAVFKGMLSQEFLVAVKILKDTVGDGKDFINEVGIIGKIHHLNVVRLLGFCADGFHRALVYDFYPNGSLEKFLVPPDNKDVFLGWEKLQQIAVGVARGIEYLHLGCDHMILHFDINPHNVLVDDNLIPKITDFGLAKLCPKNQSKVSMTAARGTLGYIAPEVFSRNFGNVSYKSDIYSYGMLLLEMVGGRKNTNKSTEESYQVLYPRWIHNLLEGRDVQVSIEDEGDVKISKKLAIIGFWCIQWNPVNRPSMKTVVQMLIGDGSNELIVPPTLFDIPSSSTTDSLVPARHQNFELEVIHEIEE